MKRPTKPIRLIQKLAELLEIDLDDLDGDTISEAELVDLLNSVLDIVEDFQSAKENPTIATPIQLPGQRIGTGTWKYPPYSYGQGSSTYTYTPTTTHTNTLGGIITS